MVAVLQSVWWLRYSRLRAVTASSLQCSCDGCASVSVRWLCRTLTPSISLGRQQHGRAQEERDPGGQNMCDDPSFAFLKEQLVHLNIMSRQDLQSLLVYHMFIKLSIFRVPIKL
jgi:hypothetical protein